MRTKMINFKIITINMITKNFKNMKIEKSKKEIYVKFICNQIDQIPLNYTTNLILAIGLPKIPIGLIIILMIVVL